MAKQMSTDISVLKAEKRFLGQKVILVGAGASLDKLDLTKIGNCPIIAVNAAITLFTNNRIFKNPWWLFRDTRICFEMGQRLKDWPHWRVITHTRGHHEINDAMGAKRHSMSIYIFAKDNFEHKRTIITDALQILEYFGVSEVYLVGIDHCIVDHQPYAQKLMWKECHFYDVNTKKPNVGNRPIQEMVDAMKAMKSILKKIKVFNTSEIYPEPVFEYVPYEEAARRCNEASAS